MPEDDLLGPQLGFKLLKFQTAGVRHWRSQKSRLVGDDMGLGKTYTAITLDLLNRWDSAQENPNTVYPRKTLVICPKMVISHWEEKLEELTFLNVFVIDPHPRNRHKFVADALNMHRSYGGYYIVHWEALRLMPELMKVQWFHIIADECHRMKTRTAQQTRAIKKLKTKYKTAMSGTAADNRPQDLWSTLNWLWPSYYTSYWRFFHSVVERERAIDPRTGEDAGYWKQTGINKAGIAKLHKHMAPWYLRRLKADVLKDLPDKYYTRIWVDLSPKQRKAYDEMARVMVAWLEEKGYTDDTALARPMVAQVIIAQLQRLQQFALGYMEHAGTKLVWVVNKQTGEREQVEKDIWRMVDPSAKLDAMMELLEDMDDGQVVIWSQFKGAITLLAKRLEAKGISFGLLTGDTPQADRGPLVADFQAGRIRVIAGTIATGGVGITLTAASTVVFLDRAWSPALNTQAEDRLHRIGQENAVQVIDLMARSTVDLGRHQQLETKMSWLRAILGDK